MKFLLPMITLFLSLSISAQTHSKLRVGKKTVSPSIQATIYLNSVDNTTSGLIRKFSQNAQYYACKDVEVLKLISTALKNSEVNKAAVLQNPWTLRNLEFAMPQVEELSVLCQGDIDSSELEAAKKLAAQISDTMSLE